MVFEENFPFFFKFFLELNGYPQEEHTNLPASALSAINRVPLQLGQHEELFITF